VQAAEKYLRRAGLTIYEPPGNIRYVDLREINAFIRGEHRATPQPEAKPARRSSEREADDAVAKITGRR
jgi:hypothetical protein